MSVINLIRSKYLLVGIVALGFVGVSLSCTEDGTTGLGDGDETGTTSAELIEMAIASLEEALFAAITGLDNVGGLDQFSFEPTRALFKQASTRTP